MMTSSPDVVVVLREYLSSRINKFGSNVGANSPGVAVDFDVVGAGVRRLLVTGEELQHETGTNTCIFLKSRRVYTRAHYCTDLGLVCYLLQLCIVQ